MARTYFIALSLNKESPVEWQSAHQCSAASHREAAINALVASPENGVIRTTFRSRLPVMAWVWDKASPRHENGSPMCVHGIELVAGLARVESSKVA